MEAEEGEETDEEMIDGKQLAEVGFQKIGTAYEDMDCQKFIEWCLKQCGLDKDLAGSNAWFREVMNNGVIMTPEECVVRLGTVPAGAFLFIVEMDGGEEARGYHDGLGNASHIGIVTGKGKGAIHSSKTAGGVAESPFKNKTIKNGGWNRVGLYNKVAYDYAGGGTIDPVAPDPDASEPVVPDPEVSAIVTVGEGQNVITRKGPGKDYAMSKVGRLPDGAHVTILDRATDKNGESWCHIRCRVDGAVWVCWMKGEFLTTIGDSQVMDPGDGFPENPSTGDPFPEDPAPAEDPPDGDGEDEIVLQVRLSRAEASALLAFADQISWQLVQILGGRG